MKLRHVHPLSCTRFCAEDNESPSRRQVGTELRRRAAAVRRSGGRTLLAATTFRRSAASRRGRRGRAPEDRRPPTLGRSSPTDGADPLEVLVDVPGDHRLGEAADDSSSDDVVSDRLHAELALGVVAGVKTHPACNQKTLVHPGDHLAVGYVAGLDDQANGPRTRRSFGIPSEQRTLHSVPGGLRRQRCRGPLIEEILDLPRHDPREGVFLSGTPSSSIRSRQGISQAKRVVEDGELLRQDLLSETADQR